MRNAYQLCIFTYMILWFMTKIFFTAKYMSCLRTSAMFISSHSIYLDLVIWTVFCQLGVTLLLMTKPSLIWKTPLFEEIQQIIFLIDLGFTLGMDKYGLFVSCTLSCYDISKWVCYLDIHLKFCLAI